MPWAGGRVPSILGTIKGVGRELAALGLWGCGPFSSALRTAPWAKAGQAEYSWPRGSPWYETGMQLSKPSS